MNTVNNNMKKAFYEKDFKKKNPDSEDYISFTQTNVILTDSNIDKNSENKLYDEIFNDIVSYGE